jgi:hypothetical protein
MAQPNLYLYIDLLDHLKYQFQGGAQDVEQRDAMAAVQTAYRDLATEHDWWFYKTLGRVNIVAAYSTGTITYTHSTRTITFSTALSSTVQGWARFGRIKIDGVIYPVKSYTDSTHVVLDDVLNPGADVAAGTSYTLFQNVYSLPPDFKGLYSLTTESDAWNPYSVSQDDQLWHERKESASGNALRWTITADPDRPGGFALVVDPYPSSATTIDFIYVRTPRRMKYTGLETAHTVGTVANSASGTAVTGTATTISAGMVGSILRVGDDGTNAPTGEGGRYPYDEQRRIDSRSSDTAITVHPAFDNAHSGCKYVVSDPVDVAPHMYTALLRGAEYQMAIARGKDANRAERAWEKSLLKAKETDGGLIKERQYASVWSYGYTPYTVDFSDVP